MNRFQQFRTYLSSDPYVFTDFKTLADLLNIPFVKGYAQKPNFKTFCLNDKSLVAVYDNYMQTVGYLDSADINLPPIQDFIVKIDCSFLEQIPSTL